MKHFDFSAGIDGLADGMRAESALILVDILKDRIHDDNFICLSAEAQLLYMYIMLDCGHVKDRPMALCRMLFGDKNGYIYKPYDELVESEFLREEYEEG